MSSGVMRSDTSADEATFTDCITSASQSQATPSRHERRVWVPELVRRAEIRPASAKRPALDRGSRSPRDPALPAARRPSAEPDGPPAVELSAGALTAIRQVIASSTATVIKAFEAKFESLQKRLHILEGEVMEKDSEINRLGEQLSHQIKVNEELRAQVEAIAVNRRLSSLILTCDAFGRRSTNENIEEAVVNILNERIIGLGLSTSDIQVAHRLQRDNKVICKFIKRSVRDQIFDSRFDLKTRGSRPGGAGPGGRFGAGAYGVLQLPPLYLNESLTSHSQELYNHLLQTRKSNGGSVVASVFSRRGIVYCRTVKNGPNIRVTYITLQRIIGGTDVSFGRSSASRRPSAAGRGGGGSSQPGITGGAGAVEPPRPGQDRTNAAPPGAVEVAAARSGAAATADAGAADAGPRPAAERRAERSGPPAGGAASLSSVTEPPPRRLEDPAAPAAAASVAAGTEAAGVPAVPTRSTETDA